MKIFAVLFAMLIFFVSCNDDSSTGPTPDTSYDGEYSGKTDKNKDVYLSIVNNNVEGYIYLVMDPIAAGAGNVTLKCTFSGKISKSNFQLQIKGDGLVADSFITGKIEGNSISGEYLATGIILTFDIWGNLVSSAAISSGSQWNCNKK